MAKHHWKAVLFDLDDTLYPELQFVQSGFRAVSLQIEQECGIDARSTERQLWALFGEGRSHVFDRWVADHDGDNRMVRSMIDTYQAHRPSISLYPDAVRVIHQLGTMCRLGLVTDGWLDVQRRKVAALRLAERGFEPVVFSDEEGRDAWKPDPRPFERALRLLEMEPQHVAYVGDNPAKDFITARRMGLYTVRVRRRGTLHCDRESETAAHAADWNCEDLDALLAHLQRQGMPASLGSSQAGA